jgi:Undecaprenyl-phosphate glucose phosphotransferase
MQALDQNNLAIAPIPLGRMGIGYAPEQSASPAHHHAPKRLSRTVILGSLRIYDFATVIAGALLSYLFYLVHFLGDRGDDDFDRYSLVSLVIAGTTAVLLSESGVYSFKRLGNLDWQLKRTIGVWSAVSAMGLLVAFITKTSENYSRGWVLGWYLVSFALMAGGRVALQYQFERWSRAGKLARHVAVVGAGDLGAQLIQKLRQLAPEQIRIVGIFDDRATRVPAIVAGHAVVGTTDDLLHFARNGSIDEIVVALPLNAETRLQGIFDKLSSLPVDLRLSLDPISDRMSIRGISRVGAVPAIDIAERPLKHWAAVTKWLEDKIVSGLMLLATSPAMALIALAIKLDSPGPVFFVQERFGFNNRPIRVLKFRTMYVDRGDPTGARQTVKDDPRVTRVGRLLRAFSLDELPQLINVIRGDMSLVGPRAHSVVMKAAGMLYHEAVDEYFRRHRVKPGLTGWAQIHGLRGETDTIEKAKRRVEYDLWYIDHWSLWLDLRIMLATVRVFFTRENAY